MKRATTRATLHPFPTRRSSDLETQIWALKDVSFDVKKGEVVGIIGRNGAGKSTLLRILSRITPPTEGSALVRGRLGSLLDRKSTRLNSSHLGISYAVFCLKKKA